MTALVTPPLVFSASSAAPAGPCAVDADELLRLSVEQYHAMAAAGILAPDDRVELLEGWLVRKMTKSPEHVTGSDDLRDALVRTIPHGWHVRSQDPIDVGDSEPEPDQTVARGTRSLYRKRHPGPADIGLVAEVADSSLRRDREWKMRIYARARIPVYWLINLVDRTVEVFTDPSGPISSDRAAAGNEPVYRTRAVYRAGERVPLALDGAVVGEVPVDALFPA